MTESKISLDLIRKLRQETQAGISECKDALEAAYGNIAEAKRFLEEKSKKKMSKLSQRQASQGVVLAQVSPDRKQAILLEINTETDFVARDSLFLDFSKHLLNRALTSQVQSLEQLAQLDWDGTGQRSVDTVRADYVLKLGENIQLRRMAFWNIDAGCIGSYVHNGSQVATIVQFQEGPSFLADDLAMQIAGFRSQFVSPEDIPSEIMKEQMAFFKEKALLENKPEAIMQKMIQGKLNKWYEEVCLTHQIYLKDPEQKKHVWEVLKQQNAVIKSFLCYAVGEELSA